jgi:proton-translocating NAD(P)+ transhydrogenase subunit alpha
VTIFGPTNLPATVPHEASQMYARNAVAFLGHLVHDGRISPERDDEIVRSTLVACDGRVVNPRVLAARGGEQR